MYASDAQARIFFFRERLTIQRQNETTSIQSVAVQELLIYLLLEQTESSYSRELIYHTLWPNLSEKAGRRKLSQTLWQLRRRLPKDFLQVTTQTIQLGAQLSFWTDVKTFMEGIDAAQESEHVDIQEGKLQSVIELYDENWLSNIHAPWFMVWRSHIEDLYQQALETLIKIKKQKYQYKQAISLTHELHQADPTNQAYCQELMKLYLLTEQPQQALKTFTAFKTYLQTQSNILLNTDLKLLAYLASDSIGDKQELSHLPLMSRQQIGPQSNLLLVGREKEKRTLHTIIQTLLADDKGKIVLVEGVPGVGKTRFIQEVKHDALWHNIQVIQIQGQINTMAPFELLIMALEEALSKPIAQKLQTKVETIWIRVLLKYIPRWRTFFPNWPPLDPVDNKQERERLEGAIFHFFKVWSQMKPILFIVEDLHYVGLDTADLIFKLSEQLLDKPFLTLVSYRPTELKQNEEWQHKLAFLKEDQFVQIVKLRNLTQQETSLFIQYSLNLSHPAPTFAQRIYQETQGNPLFVIETLRFLYQQGILTRDEQGRWHTPFDHNHASYYELPIPPAIEEVIVQHIKRLTPARKYLLEVATVLSDYISIDILEQVAALPQTEFLKHITHLQQLELLIFNDEQQLMIRHHKIKQVVYEQIPANQKITLHRSVAHLLATNYPQQVEEIARHYTKGELWLEALETTQQLAEKAREMGAYKTALQKYTFILSIIHKCHRLLPKERDKKAFDIHLISEELLSELGKHQEQIAASQTLQLLAEAIDEPYYYAQLFNHLAEFHNTHKKDFVEAEKWAFKALQLANLHDWPQQIGLAHRKFASIYYFQADYKKAEQHYLNAIEITKHLPNTTLELAKLYHFLIHVYLVLDQEKAQRYATKLMDIATSRTSAMLMVRAYEAKGLSTPKNNEGDIKDVIKSFQKALEIAQENGLSTQESIILTNLSIRYIFLGNYTRSIELLEQALSLHRQHKFGYGIMHTLYLLGGMLMEVGMYGTALPILREGLASAVEANALSYVLLFQSFLIRLTTYQSRFDEAQALVENGQPIFEQLNQEETIALFEKVDYLFACGIFYWCIGEKGESQYYFQTLCQPLYQTCRPVTTAIARSYLAIFHMEQGFLEEGKHLSLLSIQEIEKEIGDISRYVIIHFHHWQILSALNQEKKAYLHLVKAYQLANKPLQFLPSEKHEAYWQIPYYRTVYMAYQQHKQAELTNLRFVQLAHVDAPRFGRALRPEEHVNVVWTVHHVEDQQIAKKKQRRQHRLRRLLNEAKQQQGMPSMEDLADVLGVSVMTIRRDLAALRNGGYKINIKGYKTIENERINGKD